MDHSISFTSDITIGDDSMNVYQSGRIFGQSVIHVLAFQNSARIIRTHLTKKQFKMMLQNPSQLTVCFTSYPMYNNFDHQKTGFLLHGVTKVCETEHDVVVANMTG